VWSKFIDQSALVIVICYFHDFCCCVILTACCIVEDKTGENVGAFNIQRTILLRGEPATDVSLASGAVHNV